MPPPLRADAGPGVLAEPLLGEEQTARPVVALEVSSIESEERRHSRKSTLSSVPWMLSIHPSPSLEAEDEETSIVATPLLLAAFVAVGCGPALTWNCMWASVAFFQEQLGTSVLAALGLATNGSIFVGMLAYFLLHNYYSCVSPRVPVLCALTFQAALCIALPVFVAFIGRDEHIPSWIILGAAAANGAFMGLSHGAVSAVAGAFMGPSFVTAGMVGSGIATVLPTLLQLAITLSASPSKDAQLTARRTAIYVVFPTAVLGILAASIAWLYITAVPLYVAGVVKERAGKAARRERQSTEEVKRVNMKGLRRLCAVKSHIIILFATTVISTLGLAWSPHIRACDSPGSMAEPIQWMNLGNHIWWSSNLPAFLANEYNVFAFVGVIAASSDSVIKAMHNTRIGKAILPLLATLRVGFVALVICFVVYGDRIPTLIPIAAFALAAFSSGFILVAESSMCQVVCRSDGAHICAIVAMVSWSTMQFGVVFGNIVGLLTGLYALPS